MSKKGRTRQVVRFTLTGSMIRDHTSYWRHPDVFTWRVVKELEKTAQSADGELIPGLAERGREASASRTLLVCVRTVALWVLLGVMAVVVARRWEWFDPGARAWSDDLVDTVADVAAFPVFAQDYAGSLVTVAVVIGGFVMSYQVVLAPWRCWNWAHLHRFHHRGGTEWTVPVALLVIVMTAAAAVTGLGLAAFPVGEVSGVAGQAAPLLSFGFVYALWVVAVGFAQSSSAERTWATVQRRLIWALLVAVAVWTVTFLVLLPVLGDAAQTQRDHFEQRKTIILLVVVAALIIWSMTALIRRGHRRGQAKRSLREQTWGASAAAAVPPAADDLADSHATGCR